jgi:hypothetical protein
MPVYCVQFDRTGDTGILPERLLARLSRISGIAFAGTRPRPPLCWDNAFMRLELLHIDVCPNSDEARVRLKEALEALHRTDVMVNMRLLKTATDIKDTGFAGSPTITINGADIFPTGAPATELACRIYHTPHGLAGLPTVEQLVEALKNNGL